MLAYLESLCSALMSRNIEALRDLLEHPLAAALPEAVVSEAQQILAGETHPFMAPIHALQLYHQTAHLLGVCVDPASRYRRDDIDRLGAERTRQIELPLTARVA